MDIEGLAVAEVGRYLSRSDRLQKSINEKDKIPCWDGTIYFKYYNKVNEAFKKYSHNFDKKGIVCVPVQVKGSTSNNYDSKETIKYPVDVIDLENYFNNYGTIYFVVYIDVVNKEAKAIYYVSLLPKMISKIIKNKNEQNTINITLRRFPYAIKDMESIIENFISHREKQLILVTNKDLNTRRLLEENRLSEITLPLTGVKNDLSNLEDVIRNQDLYLYGRFDNPIPLTVPLECIDTTDKIIIEATGPAMVNIDREIYYDQAGVVFGENGRIVKIGKSIQLSLKDEKFNFELKGTLKERLNDLRFLLKIIETHTFEYNGVKFNVRNFEESQVLAISRTFNYYNKALLLLEKLNVSEDLELDNFTEQDGKTIDGLIKGIIDGESFNDLGFDTEQKLVVAKVANLVLLVVLKKVSEDTYIMMRVEDFGLGAYKIDGRTFFAPILFAANTDVILQSNNFNYEYLESQISELSYSKLIDENSVVFLLEMLAAYDKRPNVKLLNVIKTFSKWLVDCDESDIHLLNDLQIVKRERELNLKEKTILFNMYCNARNEMNIPVLFACSVLLDSQEDARNYYTQLNDEQKKIVNGRPIMIFYEDIEQT
ncbi:MAG: DUF4365 domain-containing protein [Phascolarctobacterium sp.]|nr:DUF4365 domain-containing protein [Clostridia bacterium]MBO5168424.1 DUF4365 domain-containing protein [Phascolarctobacterium sp.]